MPKPKIIPRRKPQESSSDSPLVLEPVNEEATKVELKEVRNWKPKTDLGRKVQAKTEKAAKPKNQPSNKSG